MGRNLKRELARKRSKIREVVDLWLKSEVSYDEWNQRIIASNGASESRI